MWRAHYIKHDLNEALDEWMVVHSTTKRSLSGLSSQEAHAIVAALNALELEVCYE